LGIIVSITYFTHLVCGYKIWKYDNKGSKGAFGVLSFSPKMGLRTGKGGGGWFKKKLLGRVKPNKSLPIAT
jgi:hypothetical protein